LLLLSLLLSTLFCDLDNKTQVLCCIVVIIICCIVRSRNSQPKSADPAIDYLADTPSEKVVALPPPIDSQLPSRADLLVEFVEDISSSVSD
jgi:hypothetical protein